MRVAGSYVARHTDDGQVLAVAVNQSGSHQCCCYLVFFALRSSVSVVTELHGVETDSPRLAVLNFHVESVVYFVVVKLY